MSSILNALRKVEEDRSPNQAGPLREHVAVAPRRGSTLWAWGVGALGGIVFAATLLLLTRSLWVGSLVDPGNQAPATSTSPVAASLSPARPARPAASAAAPAPLARPLPAPPPQRRQTSPQGAPAQPPDPEAARIAATAQPASHATVAEELITEQPGFEPERETSVEVEERLPAPMAVAQIVWHPRPELRRAWLLVDGDSERREVREGDRVGHYTVRRIEPGAVLFESGSIELRRVLGAQG